MTSPRGFLTAAAGFLFVLGGPKSASWMARTSTAEAATEGASSLVLPKPFDYYARDQKTVAEFLAFVMNNKWNGHERPRKCHPSKTCNGMTTMVIEELAGAQKLTFTKVTPGQRILVGRMENTGNLEDTLYHDVLPPNQNVQGFVFVEGGSDGKGYTVLVTMRFDGDWTYMTTYPPSAKPFFPCDNYHTNNYEADFRPCPNPMPNLAADNSKRIADASFSGAWFSCQEGCCGSSYPPVFDLKTKATRIPMRKP